MRRTDPVRQASDARVSAVAAAVLRLAVEQMEQHPGLTNEEVLEAFVRASVDVARLLRINGLDRR